MCVSFIISTEVKYLVMDPGWRWRSSNEENWFVVLLRNREETTIRVLNGERFGNYSEGRIRGRVS